jgi:hypothetical protein
MFMTGSGKPAARPRAWLHQRFAMYIVISKPKRQSMNSGLLQAMIVSLMNVVLIARRAVKEEFAISMPHGVALICGAGLCQRGTVVLHDDTSVTELSSFM